MKSRLSSLGPGIVYVLTVMGVGDLVSNSAAGAGYGYSLIWALAVTLLFRYVWVNTSAKYVLVTGESLIRGYGRLGAWILWFLVFFLLGLGHVYNLYQVVMMGTAANLLLPLPSPWSAAIWAVVFTLLGYKMIWGGYPFIETTFKVLVGAMGLSLIVSAALSKPDIFGILKGMFYPTIPSDEGLYGALFVVMALIGTEAGSMTNLTYPYFMYEKGWKSISYLRTQLFDLRFGILCMFVMGTLIQVAAAGTVRPLGIDLEGPEHLVRIFSETQGTLGLIVSATGILAASFSVFIGMTTGYGLILTDICRSYIPAFQRNLNPGDKQTAVQRDPIYRWVVSFWALSPLYIIFLDIEPVRLVLMVSSVAVIVIPVLATCLLKITNDRKLMGRHRNSKFTNTILVLLIIVSTFFTVRGVITFINTIGSYL